VFTILCKMRIYLDNCSFNRPFDEQNQPFDYTKWRQNFVEKFEDMSVEDVSKLAMQGYTKIQ